MKRHKVFFKTVSHETQLITHIAAENDLFPSNIDPLPMFLFSAGISHLSVRINHSEAGHLRNDSVTGCMTWTPALAVSTIFSVSSNRLMN